MTVKEMGLLWRHSGPFCLSSDALRHLIGVCVTDDTFGRFAAFSVDISASTA